MPGMRGGAELRLDVDYFGKAPGAGDHGFYPILERYAAGKPRLGRSLALPLWRGNFVERVLDVDCFIPGPARVGLVRPRKEKRWLRA
jgi:hypothetical protein